MEHEDPLDAPPSTEPAGSHEPAGGPGGMVADAVKKAVLAGVGALFLTEEGARKLAREWKLPKELISYVGGQAAGAKAEILRIVSDEIRRFLESEALRSEFLKVLSSMAVEIKAEIRLVDAGDGKVEPTVTRASVSPARKRGGARGA
jgi:hypothetical protein